MTHLELTCQRSQKYHHWMPYCGTCLLKWHILIYRGLRCIRHLNWPIETCRNWGHVSDGPVFAVSIPLFSRAGVIWRNHQFLTWFICGVSALRFTLFKRRTRVTNSIPGRLHCYSEFPHTKVWQILALQWNSMRMSLVSQVPTIMWELHWIFIV